MEEKEKERAHARQKIAYDFFLYNKKKKTDDFSLLDESLLIRTFNPREKKKRKRKIVTRIKMIAQFISKTVYTLL